MRSVFYDGIRGGKNFSRRAVIAHEFNNFRAGEFFAERQYVLHFGAAESVNRLVVVSYDAHVRTASFCRTRKRLQKFKLRDVRILIFVDHDDAETETHLLAHGEIFFHHSHRLYY